MLRLDDDNPQKNSISPSPHFGQKYQRIHVYEHAKARLGDTYRFGRLPRQTSAIWELVKQGAAWRSAAEQIQSRQQTGFSSPSISHFSWIILKPSLSSLNDFRNRIPCSATCAKYFAAMCSRETYTKKDGIPAHLPICGSLFTIISNKLGKMQKEAVAAFAHWFIVVTGGNKVDAGI